MKKWMMLLCCVMALNLAACGAKEEGASDRVGAQGALHFEVATQVYENEYKEMCIRDRCSAGPASLCFC